MTERKQDVGICDHCHETFHYYLVHNGFNDSVYMYCDSCGTTAFLNLLLPKFPNLRNGSPPHGLAPKGLEPFLKPCSCGGRFTVVAQPRCPKCRQPLSSVAATSWIERNAPGSKEEWRWSGNWTGLYSIVIERQTVDDNFI